MQKLILTYFIFILAFAVQGQTTGILRGKVRTDANRALPGAHVFLQEAKQTVVTDSSGSFLFDRVKAGTYRLHVSYLGYKCIHQYKVITTGESQTIDIVMEPDHLSLQEIVVEGHQHNSLNQATTQAVVHAHASFIDRNLGNSLMKSLDALPGIHSMEVGQGLSKPVIRGLGFNRVVVSENNTKMEGQQWGADHGLEIDQYVAEQIEIIKGPASLQYGSDALGGVIHIKAPSLASPNTIETNLKTAFRSVNNSLGGSIMSRMRKDDFFAYARLTWTDFGDYQVPATKFVYNRYNLPIYNKTLKNTAGTEKNFYVMAGTLKPWGKISFTTSNVFAKAGFFPGSHGIPNINNLKSDGDNRNIDLPYQQVNHFKLSGNVFIKRQKGHYQLDVSMQQNHRQEWSAFHTHYPSQQPPTVNPELELEWKLHTLTLNAVRSLDSERSTWTIGVNAQMQDNRKAGYMFLLPEFQRYMTGLFLTSTWTFARQILLQTGLRYDLGIIDIEPYSSPYTGRTKSPDFRGVYHDISWAVGLGMPLDRGFHIKANLAKSFRMPGAAELSSNGIHHGSFRYELGDTTIRSESAYQFDIGLSMTRKRFSIEFSPFAGYFPNFIYLNPSGSYLLPGGEEVEEADAGQIYTYVQSEAYRFGSELSIHYKPYNNIDLHVSVEYVMASDGTYPLPFIPPLSGLLSLEYSFPAYWKFLHQTKAGLETKIVAAQNQHARNEMETPSYQLVNLNLSTKILTKYFPLGVDFQVQNLFNTRYWNHLSFYRQIGLPEAGRNVQLLLTIPLTNRLRSE